VKKVLRISSLDLFIRKKNQNNQKRRLIEIILGALGLSQPQFISWTKPLVTRFARHEMKWVGGEAH